MPGYAWKGKAGGRESGKEDGGGCARDGGVRGEGASGTSWTESSSLAVPALPVAKKGPAVAGSSVAERREAEAEAGIA